MSDFASRVRIMGVKLFSEGKGEPLGVEVRRANDRLLQARFVAGLRADIQRYVLSKGPENFEEAVLVAIAEEANNEIARSSNARVEMGSNNSNQVIQQLTEQIQVLNAQVQNLSANSIGYVNALQGRGRERTWGDIVCFYCGGKGHIQRECRRKMRDEQNRWGENNNGNSNGYNGGRRQPPNLNFRGRRH